MKGSNNKRNRTIWRVLVIIAVLLVIITFTPVILSPGKITPTLFSMPYTLWTSMLITIILVILTYLASRTQNKD